jgi:hypothetical protein
MTSEQKRDARWKNTRHCRKIVFVSYEYTLSCSQYNQNLMFVESLIYYFCLCNLLSSDVTFQTTNQRRVYNRIMLD